MERRILKALPKAAEELEVLRKVWKESVQATDTNQKWHSRSKNRGEWNKTITFFQLLRGERVSARLGVLAFYISPEMMNY